MTSETNLTDLTRAIEAYDRASIDHSHGEPSVDLTDVAQELYAVLNSARRVVRTETES